MILRDSKLIEFLKAGSGYELRHFRALLDSPFFNRKPEVIRLFEAMYAFHPEYDLENGADEAIWAEVFPEKPFQKAKFRHLCSELTQAISEYWIQQKLRSKDWVRKSLLREQLSERKLTKWLEAEFRLENRLENESELRFSERWLETFRLREEAVAHAAVGGEQEFEPLMQAAHEALDRFYALEKLRLSAAWLNRMNIHAGEQEIGFLEPLMAFVDGNEVPPSVELYRDLVDLVRRPEADDIFDRLNAGLLEMDAALNAREQAELYAFLLNYSIRQLNLGRPEFLRKTFDLYSVLLEKGVLLDEKGELSGAHFKNVVTLGLRLEALAETDLLIEQYLPQLGESVRENAARYSLASLQFARRQFGAALRELQKVEFTDVFYHLDAKCLLAKVWYELDDADALFYLLSAFRMYLRRQKNISAYQRKVYSNFIKLLKMFARFRLGSYKSLADLRKAGEAAPDVADRTWILRKLAELESVG